MNKSTEAPRGAEQILELGKTQSETTLNLQGDLLDMCAQSQRAWLARTQKEMELWSQLASRLAGSRSLPEVMASYQECLSQRMQMAMDDGRRLFGEFQDITNEIASSAPNGWPSDSTGKNAKKQRGERS